MLMYQYFFLSFFLWFPQSGTLDLLIDCCCRVSINFYIYNDVSTSKVSQGAAHINTYIKRLSLLCICGQGLCPFSGLVCDLLLRSRRGLGLPEEYFVSQRALLGGH